MKKNPVMMIDTTSDTAPDAYKAKVEKCKNARFHVCMSLDKHDPRYQRMLDEGKIPLEMQQDDAVKMIMLGACDDIFTAWKAISMLWDSDSESPDPVQTIWILDTHRESPVASVCVDREFHKELETYLQNYVNTTLRDALLDLTATKSPHGAN